MKQILIIIVLLLSVKIAQPADFDWIKLADAWQEYLAYPSSENADKVAMLLPDSGHVQYTNEQAESAVLDKIYKNLNMLEDQIYAGDRAAVNLAFHLHTIADGAFAEELDIILGALIRIDAKLFLEELHDHWSVVKRLDALVGNFNYEYVDRLEAQQLEATLRIKALEQIEDKNLASIRDECINELKRALKQLDENCEH